MYGCAACAKVWTPKMTTTCSMTRIPMCMRFCPISSVVPTTITRTKRY